MSPKPWLLLGCGRMGRALLAGWTHHKVLVVDPQRPSDLPSNCKYFSSLAELPPGLAPELLVLAVKPQQLADVLPALARLQPAVTLSIAAGVPLARLAAALPAGSAIVRAMPNTPAAIGQGVSVLVGSQALPECARALATEALRASGEVLWAADEAQMDAVTALSGSGPAYVFYLVEVLAEAGCKLGLPPELAARLARQTVVGSGALLQQQKEQSAAQLREAVTSPGGTTAAALSVLQTEQRLQSLFNEALHAAATRAKQLAKG